MTDMDVFNSPSAEAERLAAELREVKALLREVAAQLGRIEVRVKRAFPATFAGADSPRKRQSVKNSEGATLSPGQALELYDSLVAQMKAGESKGVRERLLAMSVPDLNVLRHELGISLGSKKPSSRGLVQSILSRLNESVMMSRHTHRDQG